MCGIEIDMDRDIVRRLVGAPLYASKTAGIRIADVWRYAGASKPVAFVFFDDEGRVSYVSGLSVRLADGRTVVRGDTKEEVKRLLRAPDVQTSPGRWRYGTSPTLSISFDPATNGVDLIELER